MVVVGFARIFRWCRRVLEVPEARFVVGHPTDTKPGAELAERISEPTQVDESTFGNAVDVTGRAERAVRTGTQTAHQHVLDVVLTQNGEDSPRVERSLSHRARQPPAVR